MVGGVGGEERDGERLVVVWGIVRGEMDEVMGGYREVGRIWVDIFIEKGLVKIMMRRG